MEANGVRKEYRRLFPKCQHCHVTQASEIHEICSGPAREKSLDVREALLHLCPTCHRYLQHAGVELNCAVKLLSDSEYLDLDVINSLRGRASSAVTMADVVKHLRLR